ncbi:hypothetical protein PUV54_04040 [Hyphococcus flavus]|uniref:DUF2065 domain-containing protein n=1 Tax=Hyphococcus flavus TaxID=1866326 RepID=A0AAE9ZGZ1_9PROT|nr:hypothetical protein [Hyphococcus flavus]WDI32362.1 hypothetical protein PUV54_04040 [Hyphococcus flavus]
MITTSTVLTLSLAKAFGVYMIAGGLSGLLTPDRWKAILDEFNARAGLTYIAGVFVFVLGAAIIMVHNIWTDPLAIIISLVGWVAAAEGLILIAYPDPLLKWSASFVRPGAVKAFAVFTVVFGVALLVLGVTGTAGAV